jgi:hypothetical protein
MGFLHMPKPLMHRPLAFGSPTEHIDAPICISASRSPALLQYWQKKTADSTAVMKHTCVANTPTGLAAAENR